MTDFKKYLDDFHKKSIVIVGDLILDKYLNGNVERISPEAPVPIVTIEEETYGPGGAANTASNVSALGGKTYLFGIVGDDIAKNILIEETKRIGIDVRGIIVDNKRPTIQKIRVIGQNQQLVRIDYENRQDISDDFSEMLLRRIKNIDNIDVIIVSDYAKGTITKKLMTGIKEYSKKKNIFLMVDPKPSHKSLYKGVSLITPNKKEAEQISGISIDTIESVEKAGEKIVEYLDCNVLITTGERGMSLFEKNNGKTHIPTVAKEVYDVTGAGDTVVGVISLCIAAGASMKEAAIIANIAAGRTVEKLGPATVKIDELKKQLDKVVKK